ncbi:hypothetical protein HanHA300_Chr00c0263g0737411 [Helianthus annuus]|nr:hypothetical protein HanHA300_Chr00c0263g0737411 [Helianthus annuus]
MGVGKPRHKRVANFIGYCCDGMKGCLLQSICLMILGRPFILPPTKYVLIKYVEQYIHEQFKGLGE